MVKTNKAQRAALKRVWIRANVNREAADKRIPYRQFRKLVEPGPGCIMVPFAGMWLGIEPDGYTHS